MVGMVVTEDNANESSKSVIRNLLSLEKKMTAVDNEVIGLIMAGYTWHIMSAFTFCTAEISYSAIFPRSKLRASLLVNHTVFVYCQTRWTQVFLCNLERDAYGKTEWVDS